MKTISLDLRDRDDKSQVETLSGTFDAADLEMLDQFGVAIARLQASTLVKRGMPAITKPTIQGIIICSGNAQMPRLVSR